MPTKNGREHEAPHNHSVEESGMDTTTKTIIAVGIFGLMIFAFAMP